MLKSKSLKRLSRGIEKAIDAEKLSIAQNERSIDPVKHPNFFSFGEYGTCT
jgi:hypothetical protein